MEWKTLLTSTVESTPAWQLDIEFKGAMKDVSKSLTVLKSLALNQGWEQLVKVVEETELFMQ